MADDAKTDGGQRVARWRVAAWVTASLLLLLPLVAMQFTDEVDWDVADFATFGALLAGVIVPFDIAVRKTSDTAYLAAAGVALAAAFLLIWLNLAVGIIGNEGDPANLMYAGVLATGVIGAIIARFRPRGMARVLLATAFAQALVAGIAVIAGLGAPWSGPARILVLNGFFVVVFAGSAWLFSRVARTGGHS